MVSYPALNIVDIVIDEIALEGLDGITLEALWKRLSLRLHVTLPLSKEFIEQTWAICQGVDGLDYYKLPNPREKLVPFDRYEFVDPDFGTILEPDNIPDDIYPHFPIDDAEFGIKGSCSTYKTRKIITEYVKTLSVHQAFEEFGESLAIVASQEIRERALTGDGICPNLELTMMQYCFLERVGRSRYQGEVTQGRMSLGLLKEDPKSLFYHRKFLLDHKLITKQIHHQKASGHSCSGSLLHLPRFYVERKPKVIFLAEQVIEILKSKVNCVAEYDEIKRELQIENSIKKLFRSAFFQKVVKTDLRVPYRTIYPKAGEREWQQKNNPSKEKSIRVVQLLDPNMDVSELWGKDEVNDDDEPFELDISELKLNVPLLKQANQIVEESGNEGISQCQLAKIMGQTKLQARTILRNLVKLKIVATYMNDVGRQRVTKFVSKRYEKNSEMSKQFEQQMDRIKELTKSTDAKQQQQQQNIDNSSLIERKESINNAEAETETEISVTSKEEISTPENSSVEKISSEERRADVNEGNKPADILVEDKNISTRKKKFDIVNRIIFKYGLTKFIREYKITYGKKSSLSDPVKVDLWNVDKDFELKVDCARTGVEVLEEQSKKLANLKTVDQAEAISYYDSIDVKLVEQRPQHRLGRPASQVIGFMEDLDINERKNVRSVTYRLLKRANMIIEAVNEHKVIDDLTKLIKMINEEEDREGYDVKIDKKSILRLLQKLAKDNVVKNIKLTLRMNNREKNLTFICDPSIGIDHTVIQSAVEQAKIKFCLLGSQKIRSIIAKQSQQNDDGKKQISEQDKKGLEAFNTSKKSKSSTLNLHYDFKAGKRYGYSPKFVRMQMLHTFLFYLIYDHPGEPKTTKEMNIKNLRQNGYKIDEKFEDEMSTIYNNNVGWKMFVPPLTRHAGYPSGWALMCDVLLRMPLSIFVKIHNVQFSIPDLMDYLNHPIRKHYLVKNLPSNIRNVLLSARKYIHKIHESVTRLCYMGLIQFGPQKLKEKDQVFIYLNKRSEIMDTTSSAAGYHKIEDKDYPKTSYIFDSNQVVDKYWYDMWNTCINTQLGDRLAVQGKDILLEELSRKTDMIETVKARKPEEAVILDTGKVPGDRRGAAGVDSAFFSHLKRNWNWGMSDVINQKCDKTNRRKFEQKQRHEHLSKIKAKPLKFTEFSGLKKVTGPATQHATELRKKLNSSNKIIEDNKANDNSEKKYEKLVSNHVARQKSFVRKVLPRKRSARLKVKYDEVDFCALQQMDKLRVDWNPHEDNILLMCKVAMMYLCPNPRKQLITFTAVRDVLRTYSSNSYNKTSRACQRRLLYMYRKPETFNSVSLGVEEIKQNYYINKRFGGIIERLKDERQNNNDYEKRIVDVFKELVTYIDKRYYNISDMIESRESVIMPKTIQEFNILYRLKHPINKNCSQSFKKDVKCLNGIYSATINSVIHSSMCCGKDRTSWAYQLFKVYQQYPESLLRSAMAKIRSDQMVSIKKSALRKYGGNCMPMSSSQYQLSTGYVYKFQTKWPYDIFHESYQMICKLFQWHNDNQIEELNYAVPKNVEGIKASSVTGGLVVTIHDYFARGQLDFDIEIPDQIIMLDPRLKEKDETYLRIAKRYQDILTSLDKVKLRKLRENVVGENLIDPEVEEEDEIERRELEDKMVKEKRDKEDRDRWNYWNSRNDEFGKRMEEIEVRAQRDEEDREKYDRRIKFDNDIIVRKEKYAKVIEFGEENANEASEFLNNNNNNNDNDNEKTESDSDKDDNYYESYEDEDNHTIRFQDGTTITLSKEDIESSAWNSEEEEEEKDEEDSKSSDKNPSKIMSEKKSLAQKRRSSAIIDDDYDDTQLKDDNKKSKLEEDEIDEDRGIEKEKEDKFSNDSSDNLPKDLKTSRPLEEEEEDCEIRAKRRKIEETCENEFAKENLTDNYSVKENVETVKESNGTRVNDIINRIYDINRLEYGGSGVEDSNDMQKRCTRIALLMMREELNEIPVTDSHHAHDYFVVNMFKIFCSLKLSNDDGGGDKTVRSLVNFNNLQIPVDILPLNKNLSKLLIEDIKNNALFPKNNTTIEEFLNDFKKSFEQYDDIENIKTVYNYVEEKKEIGATSKQILSKFRSLSKDRLYRIVSALTKNRLFLRSGVTTVRYIHQSHADPWLINSYKILRLDKESLPPVPQGIIYPTNFNDRNEVETKNNNHGKDTIENKTGDGESSSIIETENQNENENKNENESKNLSKTDSQNSNLPIDEEKEMSNKVTEDQEVVGLGQISNNEINESNTEFLVGRGRMQRKRTSLLQQKDIQKAAKKLDFNTAEAIKVVIKPWIRIDGVLNRRVLDRMLGAVLGYCINHPGIILAKVQRRFVPVLQPFHTTELTEMLVRLECLRWKVLHKPKVTLFSKPAKISLSSATGLDSEDELVIEPEIDASIKFSMFIGNKSYSSDFLT